MKTKLLPWAVMAGVLALNGCGGSDNSLLGEDEDTDMMYPESGSVDPSDRPHPPQNEPTMTTNDKFVMDVAGNRVQLRGATLAYHQDPANMIDAIDALAATGANTVRLMVTAQTQATELEGALNRVAENNMVAVISLTDDGSRLRCQENPEHLVGAVDSLWLDSWLEVLVQDRFQGRVIINIADGWGPTNIYSSASLGYQEYIDTYKALIRKFRDFGFNVPLMIDAPGCGSDFNAFLVDRGKELLSADEEENLIFAASGEGFHWDSAAKVVSANTILAAEGVPFVMNAFAGSQTGDFPVDEAVFMAEARGDRAVSVNAPWASADDGVGYVNSFGQALDLTGGASSLDVLVDRRYLEFMRVSPGSSNYAPTGTTGVAMYLVDTDGNRLRLGMRQARTLRENTWNKLRFDVPEEIDPAQLMNGASEFDKTAVTHVGVEILANGKSDSAEGEIRFDNMNIFPGVPPMFTSEFNTDGDTEEWMASNAEVSVADGSLQALPTGSQVDFSMAAWNGPAIGDIDFSKTLNVTVRMFLSEEYADDIPNMWMQGFGQFGEGWSWNSVSVSTAPLVAGEWSEITYTMNFNETVDPPSDINIAQAFGLQVGGIGTPKTEPIMIDAFVIEDPSARPTKTVTDTQYKATFSSGLSGFENAGWDGGQPELSNVDETMAVSVPAGDTGAVNKANVNSVQAINFGGNLTVKARLFLPEVFEGTDFWMQFFFQDGGWRHFSFGSVDMESVNYGEWNDIELEITDSDYPEEFARTLSPQMFGFQYGDTVAGEFKLDDIEIIGDKVVDDLQPIYEQGFEADGAVESLVVDYTNGTLGAGAMLSAKSPAWHVVPFGWTASTWYSDGALSLSQEVAESVLTERGEQVVNGEDGIMATSEPVMFE